MPWSWCWGLRHDVSGAWPCHQPGSWPSLALQNRGQQARQLKQCLPVSWGWRDRVTAQRDSLAKQVPAPWLTLWPRLATYLSLLGEPRQVCSLMEGPHSLLLHHQRHRNRRLKPKLLPQPTAARITRLSRAKPTPVSGTLLLVPDSFLLFSFIHNRPFRGHSDWLVSIPPLPRRP